MNFETLDWEAEAKRLELAFGLKIPVHFEDGDIEDSKILYYGDGWDTNSIQMRNELWFGANYYGSGRCFVITTSPDLLMTAPGYYESSVDINWFSYVTAHIEQREHALQFARAFLHLDLFTPEVEVALGVSITANQKLEWTLEYEARNGL